MKALGLGERLGDQVARNAVVDDDEEPDAFEGVPERGGRRLEGAMRPGEVRTEIDDGDGRLAGALFRRAQGRRAHRQGAYHASDHPRPPAHPGPRSVRGEEERRLERVGRGDDERIRQLEGSMGCPQSRRSLRNIGTDRFDAKGEVGDELARRVHRASAAASRPDEHLRIGAGWKDQITTLHSGQRCNGPAVMRIGRVQERDRHARVEDDYRHSLRSPARYPEG